MSSKDLYAHNVARLWRSSPSCKNHDSNLFCTAAKTSCQLSSVKSAEVAGFEEQPILVSALAEAAGNCLDQKGCQEAAKMVVMGMTVVHAELEKKRLKKLEEIKSKYFSTR